MLGPEVRAIAEVRVQWSKPSTGQGHNIMAILNNLLRFFEPEHFAVHEANYDRDAAVSTIMVASFLVGVGKGGIGGLAALAVALFVLASPHGTTQRSMAVLVPVLFAADIAAGLFFFKHVRWRPILRLYLTTLAGMCLGAALLGTLSERLVRLFIATMLLLVTVHHHACAGKQGHVGAAVPDGLPFRRRSTVRRAKFGVGLCGTTITGLVGGVATILANIMGPLLDAYLLKLRLPRFNFVASRAWFFILVNLIKVPLQMRAGNLSKHELHVGLKLGLLAVVGCVVAKSLLRTLNQRIFELLTWFFIMVSAIKLAAAALMM